MRADLGQGTPPPGSPLPELAAATPAQHPRPPLPPPLPLPVAPQPPALAVAAPALLTPTVIADSGTLPPARPQAEASPVTLTAATTEPANPAPAPAPAANDITPVRALLAAAKRRMNSIEEYECRLTKREVVNGRQVGPDELVYRLRVQPFSVYMKVLSDEGQGRELLYVTGANGGKIAVLTGKGDNRIVGVGYRTDLEPDSRTATAKSRYKITEAGFNRTLQGLERAVAAAESGKPGSIRALGLTTRPESDHALEGVEIHLAPGADPLLAKGGKRRVFFDPRPDAPGHNLPVLVETHDAAGREVEYYFFHDLNPTAKQPAAAWDPRQLGK